MQRLIGRARPDLMIQTAADGQQGLALCQQQLPGLVLSDVVMPVMSGIELVRALQAARLQIPVILLSADPGHEQAALSAGAATFIFKPEVVRLLPALLRSFLPPAP